MPYIFFSMVIIKIQMTKTAFSVCFSKKKMSCCQMYRIHISKIKVCGAVLTYLYQDVRHQEGSLVSTLFYFILFLMRTHITHCRYNWGKYTSGLLLEVRSSSSSRKRFLIYLIIDLFLRYKYKKIIIFCKKCSVFFLFKNEKKMYSKHAYS